MVGFGLAITNVTFPLLTRPVSLMHMQAISLIKNMKFTLKQATKAQRGSRGRVLLFLELRR